ncbi:hypothetical protein MVEN_02175200 [Mycena venus]|uniref:F-box domain-containing protein n=1 Tax=Mycena venus TaxID=2733690 RepID=A0A8H6X8Q4_9AGAR|nr:hypothetical protein MVEN_02175200 [Mycena venus]
MFQHLNYHTSWLPGYSFSAFLFADASGHIEIAPPLLVAQICSYWRAVALATPELWTSIYLEFPQVAAAYDGFPMLFGVPGAEPIEDHTAALLELWFNRAAGYPLSISLICSRGTSLPPSLLAVIAAHFNHWGRIELAVPNTDFLQFNACPGPFPLLRSLSIQITDRTRPFSHLWVNAMRHSSGLMALRLLDASQSVLAMPSNEDLAQLPHTLSALQISGPGLSARFGALVERFPYLYHFGTIQSGGYQDSEPISSPPLKSILGLYSQASMLDNLSISTLDYLQVTLDIRDRISSFIARSGCHLTTLSLGAYEYVSNEPFITCLSMLPTLGTLELFLDVAAKGVSSAARCEILQRADLIPSLHTLIITNTEISPLYVSFLALLRARPALTHAELHLWSRHADVRRRIRPPPSSVEAQFLALTDGGMNIRVTTPTYAWPWNARDLDPVGDLDVDLFGSPLMCPYKFSPF